MELSFDWVAYQETFHPRVRPPAGGSPQVESSRPVRVLLEQGVICEVAAEGEDLSEWIGGTFEEMSKSVRGREFVAIERSEADVAIARALDSAHFHQQLEVFRDTPRLRTTAARPERRQHFLIEALQSGWARVLPSSYAVFVRLEGGQSGQEKDLIIVVRRGEVVAFHRPDLSFLSPERRKNPPDLMKYLSDKYLVPVQGLFVNASLWAEWCQSQTPWRAVAQALRKNHVKLIPWRWSVATLVGARGLLPA